MRLTSALTYPILIGLTCVLADANRAEAAEKPLAVQRALSSEAVVWPKAASPLSARTQARLTARGGDSASIWVLFTDKGAADQTAFARQAAAVSLTERARARRTKVDLSQPVFADLPVHTPYVEQILALGAVHRRSSRWLNAASFVIPLDKIEEAAALPFVVEIRPVTVYRRPIVEADDVRTAPEPEGLGQGYAQSEAQLAQINAIAAHEAGWKGDGVTLAIMDTGYRKTHECFASHYANGRVLAEWDFVQNDGNTANETGDGSTQWSHGTYIWSVAAGERENRMYGPAFHANIILCKTEDIASETRVEEDNWVAALEFADSIGADVITTSLGYLDFDGTAEDYTYADMDGASTIISIAASTCDGLGIVMCNSMGNAGGGIGTLSAPADAFDILAVGNVNAQGAIAASSSRGPTFDGRIKPEVCALGTNTRCAYSAGDDAYTYATGTSLSTPLIAGAACLVIEAHPDWTPAQVREALKMTADRARQPDNMFGWGIIDVMAAISYDASPACCLAEWVGNLDRSDDGQVTMGDLVQLLEHLYVSYAPITCPKAADMDQSGAPSPTVVDITTGDLDVLLDHLFISLTPLPACD